MNAIAVQLAEAGSIGISSTEWVTVGLTVLAVAVSVWANRIATRALAESKSAQAHTAVSARAQVYFALRSRHWEISKSLPPGFRDVEGQPYDFDKQREQYGLVVGYWYHAFDEWYMTRKLDQELLGELWAVSYTHLTLPTILRV